MSQPSLRTIAGQPSWVLRSREVEAAVTRTGGQLAPVTFDRQARRLQPYAVAPWSGEATPKDLPAIVRVLRGDFFCMPFGGNAAPYRGEQHPVHGETANCDWRLVELTRTGGTHTLRLNLRTRIRPGCVEKTVRLVDGHNAVYCRHELRGYRGPMNLGHHATLRFPEEEGSGLISTSAFAHGQVYVQPTEQPAQRGYSCLQPGALFTSLSRVPTVFGTSADLSRYPARRGYEDIAMLVAEPSLRLAWTAASFPRERFAWFTLRDPRVLTSTILWISNGGRHYAPWNGRHVNTIGLEDMTGFFHEGLAPSAAPNALRKRGFKTALTLSPDTPTRVNYIQACVPTPAGFGRISRIEPVAGEAAVALTDEGGRTFRTPVDLSWLELTEK